VKKYVSAMFVVLLVVAMVLTSCRAQAYGDTRAADAQAATYSGKTTARAAHRRPAGPKGKSPCGTPGRNLRSLL